MTRIDNNYSAGTGHSSSLWPVLLMLLLAVLVPAGCVLWFMSAAMRSESLAVRQRLSDVYRERMEAAKKELDEGLVEMLRAAGRQQEGQPAEVFAGLVVSGAAQGAVILDEAGSRVYPADPAAGTDAPSGDALWDGAEQLDRQEGELEEAARAFGECARKAESADYCARALQGQARCLVKAGKKQEALAVLAGLIDREDLRAAVDLSGRLIVPAGQLLALQLMDGVGNEEYTRIPNKIVAELGDYSLPMPAGQRRFLMHSLVEMGQSPMAWGPLLAGEDLAAEYLSAEQPVPDVGHLGRTRTPGVWHIGTAGRVALYREAWIIDRFQEALSRHESAGMSLVLRSPAESQSHVSQPFLSMWATDSLPGWTLEVRLSGTDPFAAAAGRQRALYLWIGGAGVVLIAILAILVAGFIGRQMRLTRLKNDLIATVSHELKTPLASMRMLVDMLLEGRYREQRQATEYLQLIARENLRLSRLIDNFLTFSRMERNKRTFTFEVARVEGIVVAAVEAMRERFNAPGCQLDVEVAPGLPEIVGDRDALTTVVVNLLDNAWKYTDDEKCVLLRACVRAGHVVLEVRDNGIGIPRRVQRRIFHRFFQVDQSLSRRAGGCGLGLSIVQFIVAAHGGTVSVASEPGKGSTFTVTLPSEAGAAAPGGRDADAG